MGYIYSESQGGTIKYQSVNSTTPAAVTSNLVANPKTAFDIQPSMLIPESSAVLGGVARIKANGIFSTAVVSLNLTVSIDMQSTTVASATVTPALNLTNVGWYIDITATILGNGSVEVQGVAVFGATVVPIKNTVSYTMSTAGGVPVIIYCQWGTLAVGGTISLRQSLIQVT